MCDAVMLRCWLLLPLPSFIHFYWIERYVCGRQKTACLNGTDNNRVVALQSKASNDKFKRTHRRPIPWLVRLGFEHAIIFLWYIFGRLHHRRRSIHFIASYFPLFYSHHLFWYVLLLFCSIRVGVRLSFQLWPGSINNAQI